MENENCQNCKQDFPIEQNDFSFYKKMGVPPPTWCPKCRFERRCAFINSWSLFFRNCDKCQKKMLTMYRPDAELTVYCQPCYWNDSWDGTEYGMEYDPARNFFDQVRELQRKTPQCALETTYLTLKNCDYVNATGYAKNCYLIFWADYCENTFYSSIINQIKDSCDILRSQKSELCYESVGTTSSSRVFYSENCDSSVEVWFSRNLYGCTNCVGCVNLRGKSYMIFNQKYSKEEYFEKVKAMKLDTRAGILEMEKQSREFTSKMPYREYTGSTQNLNVSGDYIFESKNAKDCYMCVNTENSRFCQFVSVPSVKDSYDYSGWGNNASGLYECANVGEDVANSMFTYYSFPSVMDTEYSMWSVAGKSNFGCANLKRKKYAILNKEYTKDEYESLRNKIINDMNKNPYIDTLGRVYKYGEFFPPEFSLVPYNDSNASRFFERNKNDATLAGYTWQDKIENTYTKTIEGSDLPDSISNTSDSILSEVIACTKCQMCYKITEGELAIYRKLNLPLPNSCYKCRESRRMNLLNKPGSSYKSQCGKCSKPIDTMHDPKLQRIIYCEKCYQEEVA